MIQVYTGNGKGKTTAALGLAVRAWGQGLTVGIFQFLKSGNQTGEYQALGKLGILFRQFGSGRWLINRRPEAEEIKQAETGLGEAAKALKEGMEVVVLDEISHAVNLGLLSQEKVLSCIQNCSDSQELVLTGRDMPCEIIACADLITEMKEVRHPYRNGVRARQGMEY